MSEREEHSYETQATDTATPWLVALRALGGQWKGLILWHLGSEPLRFDDLMAAVASIDHDLLVTQLGELEADGLVKRVDFGEDPPRILYSITDYGRKAMPVVETLSRWGRQHLGRVSAEEGERNG